MIKNRPWSSAPRPVLYPMEGKERRHPYAPRQMQAALSRYMHPLGGSPAVQHSAHHKEQHHHDRGDGQHP